MDDDKPEILRGMECVEPLIGQFGGSTMLKVPKVVRKSHPNWKRQNPKAYLDADENSVKLVYEWRAVNGEIVTEE